MRGLRLSTVRGVNAWLTSPRSLVWSGGSRNIIRFDPAWRTGLFDRSMPSPRRAGLVLNRGSRSTAAAWS